MRRRQFIAGLGSVAAWPLAARAQQATIPVVGFLANATPRGYASYVAGFIQGLKESGFVDGQNVAIEYRWGNLQNERLTAMAADLVSRKVAVMLAGSASATFAAKSATSTVPTVFALGIDPVTNGIVQSLNRPGGNITGVTYLTDELPGKRLGLLRALVPQAATFAYLTPVDPPDSVAEVMMTDTMAAARTLGWEAVVARVRSDREFDAAYAMFAERRVGAVLVAPSPLTTVNRSQLIVLAARYRIPALYGIREFAIEGGLMSYGANIAEAYRRAGLYVGRILKGDKPSDLPVERSTRIEFVINLKTAKALGIQVPETLLVTADEVIQ